MDLTTTSDDSSDPAARIGIARNASNPSPVSKNSSGSSSEGTHQVLLKDVAPFVRLSLVRPPSGFSKLGHPLLYFPDDHVNEMSTVSESDLHLLFKYYLAVVPRTEQVTGFAFIIDRRSDQGWDTIREVFRKIVSLFPARVKEVYLLHHLKQGVDVEYTINRMIDELLLDFHIFHMEKVDDLLHHIDSKFLPRELNGHVVFDSHSWVMLQEHVESFSFNARRIARKLAQFVGVLNSEDINYRACDSLREIATKNRNCYRRLRKELEDLTDHGLHMLKTLQRPDANVMQRLAVQILCKQLDQAWTYFSRSWKMQDHVYVQYLELNTFQVRFRELANTFANNERAVRDLPMGGNTAEEVNAALDKVDSCAQNLAQEGAKAMELNKIGQELLSDHTFAADCIQPKCNELKMICQKLEGMMEEKRRILHKNLDLMESIDQLNKWCHTASEHIDRDEDLDRGTEEDLFSQIRQIDYLLTKSKELKLCSRDDFESSYDDIKDLVSAQTLFAVDDALDHFNNVTVRLMQRREQLRSLAIRPQEKPLNPYKAEEVGSRDSESLKVRRENVLSEMITTESNYVMDLEEILINYKDKISLSNILDARQKAATIFGNLDEIHHFHSTVLYPALEQCCSNPASVAGTFLSNCQTMKSLYSHYCQNMQASRQALSEMGGEANPSSILFHCQQEAGHKLPLSSYLLKPMQRLTKYQLLLKDLAEASNVVCGKVELTESLEEIVSVIRVVNDSLHNITIKGLPMAAHPLGSLITHDIFTVTSEAGKSGLTGAQILLLRGNRGQRRRVFLYENHVVFAKIVSDKSQVYAFKFCLATSSLGMSSVVKGDEKKIDLWLLCRSNDLYTLEAKNKKAKDEFAAELRKVIIRQKERLPQGQYASKKGGPEYGTGYYDNGSATLGDTESEAARNARLMTRSRSLESGRAHAPLRSRSLDCAGDRNSPEMATDDENEETTKPRGTRYIVLADYMALTTREIDLTEDEVVELVKVGCAGWWYVRLTTYPYHEGWAPSTYLEKLQQRE